MTQVQGSKTKGFSIIASALGTLAATSLLVLVPYVANVKEQFAVRSAALEMVENLKEAQRVTIGHDVDRRIRITSERGYVREKRAGAGWQFEQAYVLPEGLDLSGPDNIEFQSHSALGPAAVFTISGPDSVRREIVSRKTGKISME